MYIIYMLLSSRVRLLFWMVHQWSRVQIHVVVMRDFPQSIAVCKFSIFAQRINKKNKYDNKIAFFVWVVFFLRVIMYFSWLLSDDSIILGLHKLTYISDIPHCDRYRLIEDTNTCTHWILLWMAYIVILYCIVSKRPNWRYTGIHAVRRDRFITDRY